MTVHSIIMGEQPFFCHSVGGAAQSLSRTSLSFPKQRQHPRGKTKMWEAELAQAYDPNRRIVGG